MRCRGHAISPAIIRQTNNEEPCQAQGNIIKENKEKIRIVQQVQYKNREIRTKLQASIANKELTMLIDTGATISLLSAEVITHGKIINTSKALKLIGINGDKNGIMSMGLMKSKLNINNEKIDHEFQIVDKRVNMTVDGIIGADFIEKYEVILDAMNGSMSILLPENHEAYNRFKEHAKANNKKENVTEIYQNTENTNDINENENLKKSINKAEQKDNDIIDLELANIKITDKEKKVNKNDSYEMPKSSTTIKRNKKVKNKDYYANMDNKHNEFIPCSVKNLKDFNNEQTEENKRFKTKTDLELIRNGNNYQIITKLHETERPIVFNINMKEKGNTINRDVIMNGCPILLKTEKGIEVTFKSNENKGEITGYIETMMLVNDFEIPIQLNIVDSESHTTADGQIGQDFLVSFNMEIDETQSKIIIDTKLEKDKLETMIFNLKDEKEYGKFTQNMQQYANIVNINQIEELGKFTLTSRETKTFKIKHPSYISIFHEKKQLSNGLQVREFENRDSQHVVLIQITNPTNNEIKIDTEQIKQSLSYYDKIYIRDKIIEMKKQIKKQQEVNKNEGLIIPPNSMKILKIRTDDGIQICRGKFFDNDVFIAESIIEGKNNFAKIAIFNTGESHYEINGKLNLEFENINNYNAFDTYLHENENIASRIKFLEENLKGEHWSKEEKKIMKHIINAHHNAFYIEGDQQTYTNITCHNIPLKIGATPLFTPQYKIPQSQRETIEKEIDKLIDNDIVEESVSAWNSPIMLVPKKENDKGEKQQRLVVDFRRLNEVTETETFPMPDLEEEISRMAGSKIFSTLDLKSAYHQIPMNPNDRHLTSFQTTTRKLQFKRMPFGLKGSPITWQRTINMVLSGIRSLMVYVDDIIAYSKTTDEHATLLNAILLALKNNNLKLKVDKSIFFNQRVEYLGHIISKDGVAVNPKKVQSIIDFPTPKNLKETQRFLGMPNYYRKFIKDYAKISRPLYNLCKKDIPFVWNEKCSEAIETLKKRLTTAPVLAFPDFSQTFYVTTDASDHAVGAVLSQGNWPEDKPIQFFSKSLIAAQKNYATVHKEMLGIVLAIENFRQYLYGREFVVVTDHKPLTSLFKQTKLSNRLLRWKLLLSEYNFKIIHVPGKQNQVADCLSRMPENASTPQTIGDLCRGTNDEIVLQMITRSKAKNKEIMGEAQNTNVNTNVTNTYTIHENSNMLIFRGNYDLIFYMFDGNNCEMSRKLGDKLKRKLNLQLQKNRVHEIDDGRHAILIPKFITNDKHIDETRVAVEQIKQYSSDKHADRIAINTNFSDRGSYIRFKEIIREMFKSSNISMTIFSNRVINVTDIEDINNILETYHTSILGGHVGFERMKNNIRRFYDWHNMTNDIKNFVKNCQACERAKITRHTRMPMQITTVASEAFEKIYIDFVGPINPPSMDGHKYIFTCSCDLTKFAVAVPTFDCTALTAARAIVENICLLFNIPKMIVSDNGTAFTSNLYKEITDLLRITRNLITPYHPQSNAVERFHRTLGHYMRSYTELEPEHWNRYLPYATFAFNNAVNSTTGYSPHALVFGFDIELPISVTTGRPTHNYESYKRELQIQLRQTQKLAREAIIKRKDQNKEQYDKKTNPIILKRNDLILLKNENKETKFSMPYLGPYRVEEPISETVTKIRRGRRSVKIHNNNIILAEANYGDKTPPELD